jgi:hypothetical protein
MAQDVRVDLHIEAERALACFVKGAPRSLMKTNCDLAC